MRLDRRNFVASFASVIGVALSNKASAAGLLTDALEPSPPPLGRVTPPAADQERAIALLNSARGSTPFEYITWLKQNVGEISSTKDASGHPEHFNERWNYYANPFIRQIFEQIGYAQPESAGDCTAWCAATVSWCMKRCGYQLPKDAIAALAWRGYGKQVERPDIGDLVVFKAGKGYGGHVGFYAGAEEGRVIVRGGNQSQSHDAVLSTTCGASMKNTLIGDSRFSTKPSPGGLSLVGYYRYA